MAQIEINCIGQTAIFTNTPEIFSGDVNIDTVKFTFDEVWDGYDMKTAVFYNVPKDTYPVMLDNNDVAVIPENVMADKCKLSIGVFGTNANGDVKTSKIITYHIGKGAISNDLESKTPADFWAKLLARQINYEAELEQKQADFEHEMNEKQAGFEVEMNQKQTDFESQANQGIVLATQSLEQRQTDFETEINGKQTTFESNLTQKQNHFENEMNQKQATFENNVENQLDIFENIVKGRNQALAYNSYSEMITALNSMGSDELSRGQNIYIGTTGVPDLWVYSVESNKVTYTYIDDLTFVKLLDANITVQVGHYKIAQLETQKVDLVEINMDINNLKGNVNTLQGNVNTLQANGTLLSKDVNALASNVTDLQTEMNTRYSHNLANLTFPFTAPESGILTYCVAIGKGTEGRCGCQLYIELASGGLRYHHCQGYCGGWSAISFSIPLAKGDKVDVIDGSFVDTSNTLQDRCYFTY